MENPAWQSYTIEEGEELRVKIGEEEVRLSVKRGILGYKSMNFRFTIYPSMCTPESSNGIYHLYFEKGPGVDDHATYVYAEADMPSSSEQAGKKEMVGICGAEVDFAEIV